MKNLKHLCYIGSFLSIMAIGMILASCGSEAPVNQPINHQLQISVDSATDSKVDIDDGKLPGCNALNSEDDCKLSNMAYIIEDKLYFDLYSAMGTRDQVNLKQDLQKVEGYFPNIKDAEIWVNSGGGSAFTGLAMADELLAARERGWKIVTKASGIVASAAVPVFASGEVRIAMPGTIFMVHEPAMFKWPGKETASDIRSQNELMGMLQARYMKYLVYGSTIDLAKWEDMERATTWFPADKAASFGLVTELVKIGIK